jgi:hypothetical protein
LQADWVKSRGKLISVLEHEHFLRLHNRYSDTPGHYEIVVPNTATTLDDVFGLRERFADGATVVEIPLTRLVLELVYWAQQAPVIRPGRRTKAHQSPTPSKEHT